MVANRRQWQQEREKKTRVKKLAVLRRLWLRKDDGEKKTEKRQDSRKTRDTILTCGRWTFIPRPAACHRRDSRVVTGIRTTWLPVRSRHGRIRTCLAFFLRLGLLFLHPFLSPRVGTIQSGRRIARRRTHRGRCRVVVAHASLSRARVGRHFRSALARRLGAVRSFPVSGLAVRVDPLRRLRVRDSSRRGASVSVVARHFRCLLRVVAAFGDRLRRPAAALCPRWRAHLDRGPRRVGRTEAGGMTGRRGGKEGGRHGGSRHASPGSGPGTVIQQRF